MDSDSWNLKCLDGPPVVTFDYSSEEYQTRFRIDNFQVLFKQHLQSLVYLMDSSSYVLLTEKSLLEKLIYKNWNSLRKEKSMQSIQRLKRMLKTYEQLKFIEFLRKIDELTFKNEKVNLSDYKKISLPSREILEHFLTRIYGVYRMFNFMLDLIREKIFFFLVKSIQMAVFMPNNLIFLGTVSRIYCILKKYNQSMMFVYNCLRGNLDSFKSTSIKWSPEFNLDQLPAGLKDFLGCSTIPSIRFLEQKIDKLELISSQTGFKFQLNERAEDLGIVIERNSEKVINKDKDFVKWQRALLKKCQQSVLTVFKNTYEKKFNKKIRGRITRFLESKASLAGVQKYSQFLKEIIKKSKRFKRSVIFQNSSFNEKTQKIIFKQIKNAFYLFLNKE